MNSQAFTGGRFVPRFMILTLPLIADDFFDRAVFPERERRPICRMNISSIQDHNILCLFGRVTVKCQNTVMIAFYSFQ